MGHWSRAVLGVATAGLLAALGIAALVGSTAGQMPADDTITEDVVRADVEFLAADAMAGRLTNTPEYRIAASWIRSRFSRAGLEPPPTGDFFWRYRLISPRLGPGNSLVISAGDRSESVRGDEFFPQRFSGTGMAEGDVSFVGFGVGDGPAGYDDYRDPELRGRVVIALEHDPGERDPGSIFDGLVTSQHGTLLRKTLAAQDAGAVAVLFVSDVHNHEEALGAGWFQRMQEQAWPPKPPPRENYLLGSWTEQVRIPALAISPRIAANLLASAGRLLPELAQAAETQTGFQPVHLRNVRLSVRAAVERHGVEDVNVLGVIPGSDVGLRDEVVVISAHYDHNGRDESGVYAGADDNASGVVGMLAIADAFGKAARQGLQPRRSVLFASWGTEEIGLMGAWAYSEAPVYPLANTVAVLNMDMIGGNEHVPAGNDPRFNGLSPQAAASNTAAINLIGTTRSPEMAAVIDEANEAIGLTLRRRYDNNASNLMRRSDHWPFLQHRVPALWFHAGLHPDYHTTRDRPERLNIDKVVRVSRLVLRSAWRLAQQDPRPRFEDAGSRQAM